MEDGHVPTTTASAAAATEGGGRTADGAASSSPSRSGLNPQAREFQICPSGGNGSSGADEPRRGVECGTALNPANDPFAPNFDTAGARLFPLSDDFAASDLTVASDDAPPAEIPTASQPSGGAVLPPPAFWGQPDPALPMGYLESSRLGATVSPRQYAALPCPAFNVGAEHYPAYYVPGYYGSVSWLHYGMGDQPAGTYSQFPYPTLGEALNMCETATMQCLEPAGPPMMGPSLIMGQPAPTAQQPHLPTIGESTPLGHDTIGDNAHPTWATRSEELGSSWTTIAPTPDRLALRPYGRDAFSDANEYAACFHGRSVSAPTAAASSGPPVREGLYPLPEGDLPRERAAAANVAVSAEARPMHAPSATAEARSASTGGCIPLSHDSGGEGGEYDAAYPVGEASNDVDSPLLRVAWYNVTTSGEDGDEEEPLLPRYQTGMDVRYNDDESLPPLPDPRDSDSDIYDYDFYEDEEEPLQTLLPGRTVGRRAETLSEGQVLALPEIQYKEEGFVDHGPEGHSPVGSTTCSNYFAMLYEDDSDDDESVVSCSRCAICLCDYQQGEKIRRLLKCRHAFHTGCILRWLTEEQGSCPLCKTSVLDESRREDDEGREDNADSDEDGQETRTPRNLHFDHIAQEEEEEPREEIQFRETNAVRGEDSREMSISRMGNVPSHLFTRGEMREDLRNSLGFRRAAQEEEEQREELQPMPMSNRNGSNTERPTFRSVHLLDEISRDLELRMASFIILCNPERLTRQFRSISVLTAHTPITALMHVSPFGGGRSRRRRRRREQERPRRPRPQEGRRHRPPRPRRGFSRRVG